MVDSRGTELFNGAFVHFHDEVENPNDLGPLNGMDIDGWIFEFTDSTGERGFALYTTDENNNLYPTGIYWEDDGVPCWELRVIGLPA